MRKFDKPIVRVERHEKWAQVYVGNAPKSFGLSCSLTTMHGATKNQTCSRRNQKGLSVNNNIQPFVGRLTFTSLDRLPKYYQDRRAVDRRHAPFHARLI